MSYRLPADFLNPELGTDEEALVSAVRAQLGDRGLLALLHIKANLASAPRGVFVTNRMRLQNETSLIRSRLSLLLGIIAELFPDDFQLNADATVNRLEIHWGSFTVRQRLNGATEKRSSGGKNENQEKDQRARADARGFLSLNTKKKKEKEEEERGSARNVPVVADLDPGQTDLQFAGSDPSATSCGGVAPHRDKGSVIDEMNTPADINEFQRRSQGGR